MIDLHTHSTFSDGDKHPREIIDWAKNKGLKAVALTDHDTISGIDEFVLSAKNIIAIPGVEVSTRYKGENLHIIGYLNRYTSDLEQVLKQSYSYRLARIKQMLFKLKLKGINVDTKDFMDFIRHASPSRTHVIKYMVANNIVKNYDGALKLLDFEQTISRKKPGAAKVINALNQCGVSVLAHPSESNLDVAPDLVNFGLQGVEAYHPYTSNGLLSKSFSLSKKYGLIITGGSDYHGGSVKDVNLPQENFDDFMYRLYKKQERSINLT